MIWTLGGLVSLEVTPTKVRFLAGTAPVRKEGVGAGRGRFPCFLASLSRQLSWFAWCCSSRGPIGLRVDDAPTAGSVRPYGCLGTGA